MPLTRTRPGDILVEEFLKPLDITLHGLAMALRVPPSRIAGIKTFMTIACRTSYYEISARQVRQLLLKNVEFCSQFQRFSNRPFLPFKNVGR